MNVELDLIGSWIRFHPMHNTNLSYGGNYISLLSNPVLLITLNLIVLFVMVSGYAMYLEKQKTASYAVNAMMMFGLAGALCSLIDKLFWGGSLDFIQIPHFFTFDFKDVYLSFAIAIFLMISFFHQTEISLKEYLQFCLGKLKKQ